MVYSGDTQPSQQLVQVGNAQGGLCPGALRHGALRGMRRLTGFCRGGRTGACSDLGVATGTLNAN